MKHFQASNERFYVLLGTLCLLFVLVPVLNEFNWLTTPAFSQIVVAVLIVLVVLSAVFAVGRTRRVRYVAIALAFPAVLFECVRATGSSFAISIGAHLFDIVFLTFAIVMVVRFLFADSRVTANTITAAVCVYLLLGVLGALLFSALELLRPASFLAGSAGSSPAVGYGGEDSANALYFSFVTLTTLGFGDITPHSSLAKMMVTIEALTGQLFLTVLVARLVGLQIAHGADS